MDEVYLAFDLGAESGRGVIGHFDGNTLSLQETGRFPTSRGDLDCGLDHVRRWDFHRIMDNISQILTQSENTFSDRLAGVGVDTWGVDFGLLDSNGSLLELPVAYRDESHVVAKQSVLQNTSASELWGQTGIQPLPFNTLFQLKATQKRNPRVLDDANTLLFMPDLIANSMSKDPITDNEFTIASTSQLLRAGTSTWNNGLLSKVDLPGHFLKGIVQPGTLRGHTDSGTPIYASAGHDTAAAVAAVPADISSKWAYLSSGTWSLMGVETSQPELSVTSLDMRLSNEGGTGGKTRLLKNIMGLWLVQECRRSLLKQGYEYSYEELTNLAADALTDGPIIDAVDERFLAPSDMPNEIITACRESGQEPPNSVGGLVRCCLDSLAEAYRRTLCDIESLLNIRIETLHIVGGGAKNHLLNQLTADRCGIVVIAGPEEGTAVGNILSQLIGAGRLKNWDDARVLSARSFNPVLFTPNPRTKSFSSQKDKIWISQ